jgi:hypothetical protein
MIALGGPPTSTNLAALSGCVIVVWWLEGDFRDWTEIERSASSTANGLRSEQL